MSVTFWIDGTSPNDEESFISLNNSNAAALLNWLGFESPHGSVSAAELAARCAAKLAEPPERGTAVVLAGCFVVSGRPLRYLRDRTGDLLSLATRAGSRVIRWA